MLSPSGSKRPRHHSSQATGPLRSGDSTKPRKATDAAYVSLAIHPCLPIIRTRLFAATEDHRCMQTREKQDRNWSAIRQPAQNRPPDASLRTKEMKMRVIFGIKELSNTADANLVS